MRKKRYVVLALMLLNSSFTFADDTQFSTRVVGGSDSASGAWPWIVYVQAGGYLCGGSLIDDDTVMTAAHCVHDGDDPIAANRITVTIGEYDTTDSSPSTTAISDVYIHEDYNPETDVSSNDIALLRLSTVSAITPVDRASTSTTTTAVSARSTVTLLGWGSTVARASDEVSTNTLATTLQEATLPLQTDSQCSSSYGSTYVSSTMLCAGADAGGIDSCQGDSGGPLLIGSEQLGIVSFGSGCAQAGFPGVYVRVATYDSWIENFLNGITFANSLEYAFSSVDSDQTLNLTLNNNSDDEAHLNFTLTGDSAFSFNSSNCATITANSSCTLAVTYSPSSSSTRSTDGEATLSISSDLSNATTITTTFSISSLFSTSSSGSSGGGSLFFMLLSLPLLLLRRLID